MFRKCTKWTEMDVFEKPTLRHVAYDVWLSCVVSALPSCLDVYVGDSAEEKSITTIRYWFPSLSNIDSPSDPPP